MIPGFDFLLIYLLLFLSLFDYSLSFMGSEKWKAVQGKIVGGKPVNLEKYPHAVRFYNDMGMCGGVILNTWSVLTAAHCMDGNDDIDYMGVVVGSRYLNDFGSQMMNVMSYVKHDKYNRTMHFACDIAILFLETPIKFSRNVKRALIVQHDRWMHPREMNFTAIGWGLTKYSGELSSVGLLETHLSYIPKEECEEYHKMTFTDDMFCLYGNGDRDTCKGDSGGGVMWNNFIVGITSHGDGCAKKLKPSVYANIWYFRTWIEQQLTDFIRLHCIEQ